MALTRNRRTRTCETPVEWANPGTLVRIARQHRPVRITRHGATVAEGTATGHTTGPDGAAWVTVETASGPAQLKLGETDEVFTT